MRRLYFDCFSGVSGDMIIGSLLDAGLSLDDLRNDLRLLSLHGYELHAEKTARRHLSATNFFVHVDEGLAGERRLSDIEDLLEKSSLPAPIIQRAKQIFLLLADTEAAIHSTSRDKIHFHEVGAVDAIVDVVGALVALERLKIEEVYCSPVNVGSGFVQCRHGVLPVPAPATVKLLEGVPVYSRGPEAELATPTGAVLLKSLVREYGPIPPQTILAHGYGAGKREFADWPNLLRVIIGEAPSAYKTDDVIVINTTIDDMNPENFEYLIERLLEGGALEAYLSATQAKKTRPGTLLTVLCEPERMSALAGILFSESTTFGIRYHREARLKLDRKLIEATTAWGKVRVKIGTAEGRVVSVSPEFEDCRAIARSQEVPLKTVYDAAKYAAKKELGELI